MNQSPKNFYNNLQTLELDLFNVKPAEKQFFFSQQYTNTVLHMRNALSRNLQKSINSSLLYVREFHVVTIVPKKK